MSFEPIGIQLVDGFEFGKGVVTEIILKRPLKAKDMYHIPAEGITLGHLMDAAASWAGYPPSAFGELTRRDMGIVQDVVAPFFGGSPEGGKNS